MKTIVYLFALSVILFSACKKSSTEEQLPDGLPKTAETKSQYNNTSFGVYKGVILGSSGNIILRINNGDNTVKGYLTIDNQNDTLATTQQLIAGQPIVNLNLTGRISSMTFSANADGSNAKISNLNIAGHPNPTALIVHENSTQQVLLYEGTFSGDLNGRINFVKIGTPIRSQPVEFIAKISTDNFYLRGQAVPEVDTARTNTHYMYDYGNPVRSFEGYPTFTQTKVTGTYASYVNNVGLFRGTFDCIRTY